MKKYLKEFIIFILQLCMFYIFPMFAGPTDAIGMVFGIIIATLILSFVLGIISGNAIKFLYPIIAAVTFIPTVMIYYNGSALIHAIWYLLVAGVGVFIGSFIRFCRKGD